MNLQPRELSRTEVLAGMERHRRMERAHAEAMVEVMSANGPFWNTSSPEYRWDNEQWLPIFCAVRMAIADETLTAIEFRALVLEAVRAEGLKYAAARAEAVDE